MLFKNVASQKIHVYAYDSTTGAAKTGDAANITAYVSLDGTANAIDDTNPAEVDATNMPGVYVFDLAQAETNCNSFALYAKSATSNIRIEPIIGFTTGAANSLSVNTGTITNDAITAAAIATGAIDADALAADAGTELGAAVKTAVEAAGSHLTLIKTKTDYLPSATAGAAGGVFIAGTNAPVTITGSGNALSLISTGADGSGLLATGNSNGHGISASGGVGLTSWDIYSGGNGIKDVQDMITYYVDPIKGKTDSLTFTVAGDVDCNVQTWKGATAPAMTGDAYALIGAAGAGLTALAPASTALSTAVWTNTKAGYIDAAISTAGGGSLTAAEIADAVWDEVATGHIDTGKAGAQLWTVINTLSSGSAINITSTSNVIESE